ncbi:MAG: glycoside hydrolase family 13 protein [Bacteroidota bacterium]
MMKKIQYLIFAFTAMLILGCNSSPDKPTQIEANEPSTPFEDAPEWASEVVWYQIFVERFRNGDPTNDPTKIDIEGTYPGVIPENWAMTPWTHDWYKPNDWFSELEGAKDFGGWPIENFGQKAQLRRYGGDMQGVLDKINYLDSLGVTAVYFNPVNDAPSLHKYDARHWRHVDRTFGPDPKKDIATMAAETPDDPSTWQWTEADKMFLQVINEMHARGMKVILDFSWNHTGHTFWAWQDVLEKQQESKYADWYWIKNFDDPATPENEFEYRGWFGVHDLPEIRETEYHDHAEAIVPFDGQLYNSKVKEHIFNVSQRWLDPNNDGNPSDGVDGFRLDVAAELPFGFWRDYRKFVRDINPDAYLLGEVWWEVWPDKLLDPKPFVEGDIFDAPMNYRWYRAARHFFNAAPDEIPVTEFVAKLKQLGENLRKTTNYSMMNLMASHDSPRVLTSLFNKNKYKYNCTPFEGWEYKVHRPDEATYATLALMLAHQFTYIGSPHIWAGDEMGMWGGDDPSCRKPLTWPDMEFESETIGWDGNPRDLDEVGFNQTLFDFYRKVISIRNNNSVLTKGDIEFIKSDDDNKILAYSRFDNANEVIAVFNTSNETKEVSVPRKFEKAYADMLRNQPLSFGEEGLILEMPARSASILVSQ